MRRGLCTSVPFNLWRLYCVGALIHSIEIMSGGAIIYGPVRSIHCWFANMDWGNPMPTCRAKKHNKFRGSWAPPRAPFDFKNTPGPAASKFMCEFLCKLFALKSFLLEVLKWPFRTFFCKFLHSANLAGWVTLIYAWLDLRHRFKKIILWP